jgi:adenosylmethionine-8-amino-7-oxononanoate aminotransferase
MNLSERDQKVIWHPYTQMQTAAPAIGIIKGEGAYLFAEDGRKYLDISSSWWVNLHGHAHPYIAKQVSEQLSVLEHVIFAGFTHQPAVELAEQLISILPKGQERIFYSDNGSTAVEIALKMALQYWYNSGKPRNKIIAFKEAYHGDTFGAMSVSGRSLFTDPFSPLLFDVIFIDAPVPGMEEESLGQMKKALQEHDDVAAFIFEPLVQGTAGMIMHSAVVLDQLIGLSKDSGVLTIADEVMTGFGRTGKLFATDYLDNVADMICLSKGLTGGTMPLGVTSCNSSIYEAFLSEEKSKMLFHGHSYTANPLACRAALASMELLLKDSCRDAIARIAENQSSFADKIRDHKQVTDARSLGTILAIELRTAENTSYLNPQRDILYQFFLDRGILMRPLGNIIYLLPPYCTTSEDLEHVYKTITAYLETIHQS